jgi:hypothetical protein
MTKRKSQQTRCRLNLEMLEQRALLAGDIAAGLGADGLLAAVGDDLANGIQIREVNRATPDASVVRSGVTQVTLDAPLLAAAANLTISSVNGDGVTLPPDAAPTVPFPITPLSDLRLTDDGRFPILGAIAHEGTVGFNDDTIVVGDFDIGFDATRVSGVTSGFYVADTVGGLGVLFDVSAPVLEVGQSSLAISRSDLLVSPEFAAILLAEGLAKEELTGADVGDAELDAALAPLQTRLVEDGATSVVLNFELLASVGLNRTGVDPTADSALEGGVGFEIDDDSTFQLLLNETGDLVPLGGLITHSGTVTFNQEPGDPESGITIGDFSIGFDASRASGGASGFYVEDTVGGLGILFDVAPPSGPSYDDPELSIGPADLLVSPEFSKLLAHELGVNVATGQDVGDAQIDALLTDRLPYIQVKGTGHYGPTSVNGGRSSLFPVLDVNSLSVDAGGGRDSVNIRGLELPGSLTVDVGGGSYNSATLLGVEVQGETILSGENGSDWWWVYHSQLGSLVVDTAGGNDRVSLLRSQIASDAAVDLGSGNDVLSVIASDIAGHASFDGGPGRDRLLSVFSQFDSIKKDGFGWRWGWSWGW